MISFIYRVKVKIPDNKKINVNMIVSLSDEEELREEMGEKRERENICPR